MRKCETSVIFEVGYQVFSFSVKGEWTGIKQVETDDNGKVAQGI